MGTPEFGAIILEKLIKNKYKPILVVTSPDKKKGRKQIISPSPVKIVSKKYGISVDQPKKIKEIKLKIKKLKPDLGIVASFGQIIPSEILPLPKFGFINVHPSLLPKYRGPSPIQAVILKGEKKTGVSIIKMIEKVDAGPILKSEKLKAQIEKLSFKDLHDRLANLGAELLIKVIPDWSQGKIIAKEQDEKKASYTKIIKKEDGRISWQKPAQVLEREVRAFYPWPGSYTFWKYKNRLIKIKILKARILKSLKKTKLPFGKVLAFSQEKVGVACKKDFLIIETLQMEGKKETKVKDFLKGYHGFKDSLLV